MYKIFFENMQHCKGVNMKKIIIITVVILMVNKFKKKMMIKTHLQNTTMLYKKSPSQRIYLTCS